jgi:hypothetical protein
MGLMRVVVGDLPGWTLDASKKVADCPRQRSSELRSHGSTTSKCVRPKRRVILPAPAIDPRDWPGNTVKGRYQGSEVDGVSPPGSLHFPKRARALCTTRDAQVLASGRLPRPARPNCSGAAPRCPAEPPRFGCRRGTRTHRGACPWFHATTSPWVPVYCAGGRRWLART